MFCFHKCPLTSGFFEICSFAYLALVKPLRLTNEILLIEFFSWTYSGVGVYSFIATGTCFFSCGFVAVSMLMSLSSSSLHQHHFLHLSDDDNTHISQMMNKFIVFSCQSFICDYWMNYCCYVMNRYLPVIQSDFLNWFLQQPIIIFQTGKIFGWKSFFLSLYLLPDSKSVQQQWTDSGRLVHELLCVWFF